MPQSPDWKRALETGIQFTELRRSQAHQLAIDLVAQGQLARDQVGAAVDELIEISRNRSEELRKVVSSEVQRQLGALGLATQNDLAALERRLRGTAKAPAKAAGATKKSPKTAPAKKAPAKKAPAKKAPAKSAASKASVVKTSAVKTTKAQAGKAAPAARKAPAKKAR